MRPQGTVTLQVAGADGVSQQSPNVSLDGSSTQNATFNTAAQYVGNCNMFALSFSCPATGSPLGTVKLQACLDPVGGTSSEKPDRLLVNWIDLQFKDGNGNSVTTQAVSGASQITFEELSCSYRWVRAIYTLTSGTIAPTVRLHAKGS